MNKSEFLTRSELEEFRKLYTVLYGDKDSIEETPEIISHPGYKRYKQLAPRFYAMHIQNRKERGMRI